jgi:adenylate cyclase
MAATIELADVATGENLFTEQFDGALDDVHAVQNEIVRAILGAIEPELLRHERERMTRTPPGDATAYEQYQRGQLHHYRYTPHDNMQARSFFRNVLRIDPNYARAAAALSVTLGFAAQARYDRDLPALKEEARALARHAVWCDKRDPQRISHWG